MLVGIHSFNQMNRGIPVPTQYWELMSLLRPGVEAVKGFSYYSLDTWSKCVSVLQPKLVVIRLNHIDDLPKLLDLSNSGILHGREVVIEVFNEPNNPIEGLDIDTFLIYYTQVEMFIRLWLERWKVCFPGLSPNYAYLSWWDRCTQEIARADYLGIHLYYNSSDPTQQRYHLVQAQELSKPILVTEYCYTGGESGYPQPTSVLAPQYVQAAQWLGSEGVKALFYFILASDDPHWSEVGETFDIHLATYIGKLKLEESMSTTTIGNLEVTDLRGDLPDEEGAMPPVKFTDKDFISIHHTATGPLTTPQQVYSFHKSKGWGGIGYNFLIEQTGIIYYVGECNTERAAIGANPQANRRGIHIAFIWDTSKAEPTEPMLKACKTLIANIQHAYGWWLPVVPHRLFNANTRFDTSCPPGWRNWWSKILRAVGD